MKRGEILYNALSGINENKIADAYEYRDNRKKEIFHNVLKGAGIAAIFCSFIVLSFLLLNLNGPRITEDPFTASSGNAENTCEITADASSDSGESTEEPNVETVSLKNCPDDTFYSMSTKESYEKYGIISLKGNNFDRMFDGVYIYGLYFTENVNINSKTLGKYEYPNGGEWSAACTDPLCSHKAGSGCPFYNCNFDPVYYEGKIYFTTVGGSLCVYDKNTNKSTSLIGGCYNCVFNKYDGNLYFIYSEENDDFDNVRVFTKIQPDSKTVELGRLEEVYVPNSAVYQDRYAIDYKAELTDSGGKINVIYHDLNTKEVKTITEFECPGAVIFHATQTYTLYKDKLLMETRYYTSVRQVTYFDETDGVYKENTVYEDGRTDVWLIDLKTGEKRFICSPDDGYLADSNSVYCTFSSKCVMWNETRLKESDPFTVHILFPYTDKEEVYDISDIVKKETGDTLPLDTCTVSTSNSAVVLRRVIDNKMTNTYEIDLESKKVYKYDLK